MELLRDSKVRATKVVAVGVTSSALALGCGDDGNGISDKASMNGAVETSAQPASPEPPRQDRREAKRARAAVTRIYTGLERPTDISPSTLCDVMSRDARRETQRYVNITVRRGTTYTCEEAVGVLVERSKGTTGFRGIAGAKVVAINVEGNRTTATVRFGNGDQKPIALVKEDGEWKLAALPAEDKE